MRWQFCRKCKGMKAMDEEARKMDKKNKPDFPCNCKHEDGPNRAHFVFGEIEPYMSPIDRHMVTSRKDHRNHMRQHGCIEAGNEWKSLTRGKLGDKPGEVDG